MTPEQTCMHLTLQGFYPICECERSGRHVFLSIVDRSGHCISHLVSEDKWEEIVFEKPTTVNVKPASWDDILSFGMPTDATCRTFLGLS